jgi:hypothetical protein
MRLDNFKLCNYVALGKFARVFTWPEQTDARIWSESRASPNGNSDGFRQLIERMLVKLLMSEEATEYAALLAQGGSA